MLAEASRVCKAHGNSSLQHSDSNFILLMSSATCAMEIQTSGGPASHRLSGLRVHTDCRIASGNNDNKTKSNVPLRCIRAHSTDRIGKRDKVSCPDGSTDSFLELTNR